MSRDVGDSGVNEKGLIVKAQAGGMGALGELLMAHQQACYALAMRLTRNPEDAADVCQDAFVRASRDVAGYRPTGAFRSWLFSLIVHAYGDRLDSERARRRREEEKAVESRNVTTDALDEADRAQLKRNLDESMGHLPDSYRVPIILRYEQGLSCAEAATVLAVPEGTVKTNIRRGLEKLRGLLTRAGYTCAAPAVVAALQNPAAVRVPASLTAFIKSLASGAAVAGKAAAGAGATAAAAGSLALAWKLLAGLSLAGLLGAGVWGGWRLAAAGQQDPVAAAPVEKPNGVLDKPVTLPDKYEHVSLLLKQIAEQTGLRLSMQRFRNVWIGRVRVKCKELPARAALDLIARHSGLSWKQGAGGEAFFYLEDTRFAARTKSFAAAAKGNALARAEALVDLCATEDLRAMPHLAKAMQDESLLVRSWAAKLLSNYMISTFGPQNAGHWLSTEEKQALVTALIVPECLGKLGTLGGKQPAGQIRQYSAPALRLRLLACLDEDPRAWDALIKTMDGENLPAATVAASSAAISGNVAYIKTLIKISRSGKPKEKPVLAATLALKSLDAPGARKTWLEVQIAKGGRFQIQNHITRQDLWAVSRLLEVVRQGKPDLRSQAASALAGFIGTKQAGRIAGDLSKLYMANPKSKVAADLARTLASLGEPAGSKALCHALATVKKHELTWLLMAFRGAGWKNPDEDVETAVLGLAREALKSARPNHKQALGHSILSRTIRVLGLVGGKRSIEFIRDAVVTMPEPKGTVYWDHPVAAAFLSLRQIDGAGAQAALQVISRKAKSGKIRRRASFALLYGLDSEKAAAGLLKLADESAADDPKLDGRWHVKFPLRKTAAGLAYSMPGPELAKALRKLAGHKRPAVRLAAAAAMRDFPDADFRKQLFGMMADDSPDVRQVARMSVETRFLRSAGNDRYAELRGMLASRQPRIRACGLKAMEQLAFVTSLSGFHDQLIGLFAKGGDEGKLARSILRNMTTPRAVGWRIGQLGSKDPAWRRKVLSRMVSHLDAHDPRIAPAVKACLAEHPDALKWRPRPKPKPKTQPPEVF
jgi:RNA polymerase sigma-70 factor, ECF subfamily